MVSTDRISAFDLVLPTGIPDKGRVLTPLSRFWFDQLSQENHLISTDLTDMQLPVDADPSQLDGRTMRVKKKWSRSSAWFAATSSALARRNISEMAPFGLFSYQAA